MKKGHAAALLVIALAAIGGGVSFLRARARHRQAVADTPAEQARAVTPLEIAEVAYDGKLASGWEDWGWGPHQLPQSGPAKVVFSGYGGIILHHAELAPRFGALSFRFQAPESWPPFLAVSLKRAGSPDSAFPSVRLELRHLAKLADGWQEALVGWDELDPQNIPFDRVAISARETVPSDWVRLDKIVLTKPGSGVVSTAVPTRPVPLGISCIAPSHPINPLIYGAAHGDWQSGETAQRIGGNPMTRLNWQAGNLWNTGNDWFFENVRGETSLQDWLAGGVKQGLPSALTVPMIGWVAKDATSVGFPKSKFPEQRKFDPARPEAGDGHKQNGSPLEPGPPSETSIPAPPEMFGRYIAELRAKDAASGQRSVATYILDNEPSLWHVTHHDVHPDPLTYDELLDRTLRYASAIRKADPDALIAGPAEWGWDAYFYSAKDSSIGKRLAPDRRAHGGLALIPWYLQQLRLHEARTGERLLDVLDVHFYPAADGLYGSNARTDPEAAALRLRATRSLWDPSYKDESWIDDRIRLIPRLKEWVAENYPGRKISIGEWSFGADEHISGALATAEALGRFGQQGIDAAYYWGGPKAGTGTFWAFRAFRNFDGQGARFLDISLSTREAELVSLFASRNEASDRIVAVVINRDANFAVDVDVELQGCGRLALKRSFSYARGDSELKVAKAREQDGHVRATLEPYSLQVLELTAAPER